MSKLFAMCIPVVKGKEKDLRSFLNDLNGKYKSSFKESRKKLDVRERAFHQVTPMGEIMIVTLEGDNPAEAFSKFAAGNDEFTTWFTGKVKDIHGIDLTAPPPQGQMPVLMVDSNS
jgi:hypothetical protein